MHKATWGNAVNPRPVLFECEGERLVGMLHPGASPLGLVVVVGGPQYRVGSHRHFVQLAQVAVAQGHPVLRFDARGMGDSTGGLRDFRQISSDIRAAIDALCQAQAHVRRVVLWGLCDGASAAMMYLHDRPDERVAGLCLLNPWVRSDTSLARTHVRHYYLRRLTDADFWRKLMRGDVARGAWAEFWSKWRAARRLPAADVGSGNHCAHSFQERMRLGWEGFGGSSLLVLSGNDYTAAEFLEHTRDRADWQALLARPSVRRMDLPAADHTLSARTDGAALEVAMLQWLSTMDVARAASGPRTSSTAAVA